MDTRQTRQFDMFKRVVQLGGAFPEPVPDDSPVGKALAAVAAAVAQMAAHHEARLRSAIRGKKEKVAARQALATRLATMARTARFIGTDLPGADSAFQVPTRRTGTALLTSARLFIREAESAKTMFVDNGMPESFVQDLKDLTDNFERALLALQSGKSDTSAARAGLGKTMAEGMKAVRRLDLIVANSFAHDQEFVARWKQARHVGRTGTMASEPEPAASEPVAAGALAESGPDEPLRRAS